MDDSNAKRRRGLGVVTPNACTECRKKRAKCDGQNPCGRCAERKGVDCVYEIPVRQSKEHMRNEIEQLRTQQSLNDRIFAALVSDDGSEQVLEELRSGATTEAIADRLDKGKSKEGQHSTTYSRLRDHQAIDSALKTARSIASTPPSATTFSDTYADSSHQNIHDTGSWLAYGGGGEASVTASNPSQEDMMRWSPDASPLSRLRHDSTLVGTWHQQPEGQSPDSTTHFVRGQGMETILGQEFGADEALNSEYLQRWTAVTSDSGLVEHLMALYFCWEYPTFASLSKEHFLEDYRLGRPRHCSSLLVNAILAVGCRFSTVVSALADPNDSTTSGDHFFGECLRLLNLEDDRHRLTTVQALGLMSIREASSGRTSESLYYSGQAIRLAIEMGLHLERESGGGDDASLEHAVRSATFWGAFALDQCWSLCVGRLPQFSKETKLIPTPTIVDEIESAPWIPYTDDGDGLPNALWQRQLTGNPGAPLERNCTQPSNVRSVYKTFCELSEIVHKAHYTFYTPGKALSSKAVLDIYTMYLKWYEGIPDALRLGHNFTPAVLFAHMYYHFAILLLFRPFIKLDIVGSGVSPRDVCIQAAEAITSLVNSYDQLYTLRRTPSFVPYFVLTSSITHLVAHGTGPGGPEKLHQGIADLQTMAVCHGFSLRAQEILRFLATKWNVDFEHLDDDLDPKNLGRPRSTSFNQFSPNIDSADVVSDLLPIRSQEANPLFWPFPLQGRPLLGGGDALQKSGFKIIPKDNWVRASME